ncbi:uncharacterized protein BT62DRAFT_31906 [Guyanagaster necrorhizus]|uniref:Uncharacterized protein n=1 Tax=Guyanagaster necrorhizus TaxID=856835 RepID=A0A9P7W644_9AGAR|nr:uncharacterized protein BT62DRAFT_31906 [Guyanagaster necrorhizus MCA 3950]KAG7452862.1 hypothetical protein BT62DRAFT_31906 [Guyanagaster necrorhizus MCA 3950]
MTYCVKPMRRSSVATATISRDVLNVSNLILVSKQPQQWSPGVQSPSCTEGNKVCSKSGALVILKALLGYEVDPASIPDEHDTFEGGTDTIVSASHVRKLGDIKIERNLK